MIEPTPGRIVWFYPNDLGRWKGPVAAMIVFVHHPRLVNLTVFDPLGRTESRCQVQLLQDDDPKPEESGAGYAEWMPYQKGQAARHDSHPSAPVSS